MEPIKPLSSDTQREIERFSREVTAGLDSDIQHEVAAHVSDKIQSYVRGQETISEADALVLARHHFGQADMVRSLLCETNPSPRLAAMSIVAGMFLAYTLRSLVGFAYGWICTHLVFDLANPNITTLPAALFFLVVQSCVYLTGPAFLLFWLNRERRKHAEPVAGLKRYRALLILVGCLLLQLLYLRELGVNHRVGYAFFPVGGESQFWFNRVTPVLQFVLPILTAPVVLWSLYRSSVRTQKMLPLVQASLIWLLGTASLQVVESAVTFRWSRAGEAIYREWWLSYFGRHYAMVLLAGCLLMAGYIGIQKLRRRPLAVS